MTALLPAPAARDWDFPRDAAGLRVLLAHGRAQGLTPRQVLAGTGLRTTDLPRLAEVTARQELRAVRNLQSRLGADAGAALGRRYQPESFGTLGLALLTSRTVLDAVALALRYVDLSFAFAIPRAEVVGDEVVGTLDGATLPADVRRFLVHRDATAVREVLDGLVPGGVGAVLELEDERATVRFAVTELARPVPRRDARTLALAEAVCREVVSARRARSGPTQEVRVLITQRLAEGAPMAEVAAEVGLSERSLRRLLAEEGTSYRQLLDEVRSALAAPLLAQRSLPLEVVAERLGYTTASAFIVAHRRWTGRTPRA